MWSARGLQDPPEWKHNIVPTKEGPGRVWGVWGVWGGLHSTTGSLITAQDGVRITTVVSVLLLKVFGGDKKKPRREYFSISAFFFRSQKSRVTADENTVQPWEDATQSVRHLRLGRVATPWWRQHLCSVAPFFSSPFEWRTNECRSSSSAGGSKTMSSLRYATGNNNRMRLLFLLV